MLMKNLLKIKKNLLSSFKNPFLNLKTGLNIFSQKNLLINQKKLEKSQKNLEINRSNFLKIQKRFYNSKKNEEKNNQIKNLIKFQKRLFNNKKIKNSQIRNILKSLNINNLIKFQKKYFTNKKENNINNNKEDNNKNKNREKKNYNPDHIKKLIRDGYSSNIIALWLLTTASIVLFMICLGGYTRLTKSGLSMTKWKPINSKYPSSEGEWKNEFDRYKETPEFIEGNPDISLKEFKSIFFVEYFHRSVGRFIGLVFGLPLCYFNYKGYFTKVMKKRLFFFFLLGGFQGLIGWWMVKSGFEKKPKYQSRPRVSTYRLLTHNSFALILYSSLLYNSIILLTPLKYKANLQTLKNISKIKKVSILLLHLVALNLISGVTVAGIDAGKVFNTWPLMNGAIIPNNYWDKKKRLSNLFENCATVQFNHRTFAYITYFVSMVYFFKFRKVKLPVQFIYGNRLLVFFINFQIANGVLMVLKQVPVEFGVLHQGNGVCTLSVIIFLMALCSPRMIII